MVQNCHLPLTRPVTVNAGLALYRAARGDAVIVTEPSAFYIACRTYIMRARVKI